MAGGRSILTQTTAVSRAQGAGGYPTGEPLANRFMAMGMIAMNFRRDLWSNPAPGSNHRPAAFSAWIRLGPLGVVRRPG